MIQQSIMDLEINMVTDSRAGTCLSETSEGRWQSDWNSVRVSLIKQLISLGDCTSKLKQKLWTSVWRLVSLKAIN